MNKTTKLLQLAALGSLVMLLQACGSADKRGDVPDTFEPSGDEVYTQDSGLQDSSRIQHSIGNAAIVAIWDRAEEARLTGDVEGAIAQLERAIRIDPTDPVIWSRMAELRLEQGNFIAAENIATKSNQLNAGSNAVLAYRNWLIIAEARKANGDLTGAQEAKAQAAAYKQ